jgi:DNA mismatch repair protein MutH
VITPPTSEQELLTRARNLVGLRLGEVADALRIDYPANPTHAKGWIGQLLEHSLGADAGSRPEPDFTTLGVELKTIPLDSAGRPSESTYICVTPAIVAPDLSWETSLVFRKLQRVLWVPIEAHGEIIGRRVGWPFLWSPTSTELATLRSDWEEIIELIATGQRSLLNARLGTYLQIRPKAAHGRSRTSATNASGAPEATLPRGFYLRAKFTRRLIATNTMEKQIRR